MHNHLHLVIEADDIPNIIRRFKSFTARKIIDLLKAKNQIYYLRKLETRKHDPTLAQTCYTCASLGACASLGHFISFTLN